MQDPRILRAAGLTTLAAFLAVAAAAPGCSSGPKKPEPPPKTSPPMTAKGDVSTAKPGEKPAPAPAPTPAKGTEVAKATPPKVEPVPAPAPAKKPEEPKPEPKKETPPAAKAPAPVAKAEEKPAPSSEFPPKPPVNVPEAPKSHEVVDAEPAAPAPGTPAQPVPPTPAGPGAAPKGPGVAPAVVSPATLEDEKNKALLKALSEEKRIEIERRKFLAGEYAARGEDAFKAMKFQDSKEWALKALEEDSGNAAARDLLVRSRSALGERVSDVQDLAREMAESRRVKAEMAQEKVRALYENGRAEMAKNNHDGAIRNFEDALTVIQQDPYGITWGDLKSNTEARLREARAARDRALETARRQAAADAYRKVKQEELERQMAEERKWRALMDEASAAYDREDYAVAEDLARQAVDLRPSSGRAVSLMNAAGRARHGQTTEATRQKEKEEFRRWKAEMVETTTPYSSVLNAPSAEHWDRITRLRKSLGQEGAAAGGSPETEALRNRLASELTTVTFEGTTTLSEAVGYLSARHNINILVDEAVKADADAQPLPAIQVSGIPLKDALDLLLTNTPGLVYRVQPDVVKITKPELAREPSIVRIHPVADLTMKINNFVAPNLILKPAGAEADEKAPPFGKTEEGKPAYGEIEDLVTLIKDNVGENPDVWSGAASIAAHGDSSLLVVAEPALQDAVARFLGDLRKFSGLVVNIESRFLSVTDNFLRDVGVDIRGLGGVAGGSTANLDDVTNGLDDGASQGYDNGGVGLPANASGKPSSGAFFFDGADGDYRARTEHIMDRSLSTTLTNVGGAVLQWTLLDDTQLSVIWKAVEKKQEARVLQSPNLTVYNTQRANITLINQLAFVQDFDVEVAQTAFIADPQVAIIQDGLDLDVRPVVSNDRRYVTLQLQPTIATLQRPIQTFTTSLGAFTSPVTLQLPEINIQKAQTTVRVPDGGTLLIGGLKNISEVDLKSETPYLSKIPIVSYFFTSRGTGRDYSNLLIIVRARILDMGAESQGWGSR